MNKLVKEKCFYCDNPAEYSQVVSNEETYFVDYVCKNHLLMGLSS